jgi:hypothetical protein
VQKIEQLARSLEAANPTRAPLRSPLLNGRWALQYTTCKGTLGGSGFLAPSGPIHQTVDIFNQKVSTTKSQKLVSGADNVQSITLKIEE